MAIQSHMDYQPHLEPDTHGQPTDLIQALRVKRNQKF